MSKDTFENTNQTNMHVQNNTSSESTSTSMIIIRKSGTTSGCKDGIFLVLLKTLVIKQQVVTIPTMVKNGMR